MLKLSAAAVLFFLNIIFAQSNVNPDISLIGTFNTFTNFNNGSTEKGKINFDEPSVEMFITGYLNPFAKASADIAYHDGEFAAEEVYAEILRGLPLDMQIKAGKYLLGFGKLNTTHEHAWPFLDRPLVHQIYFGEEGLNDIGIDLSFILPTEDFFTSFDIGIYKGDGFRGISDHHHGEEIAGEEVHDEFELQNVNAPVALARLSTFFSLSDYSNLEIGLSGAAGILGKANLSSGINDNINFAYGGIDFKYKYKPDAYTAITLQGEGILNHRDVVKEIENAEEYISGNAINTFGGFLSIDYKFNKIFSVGAKYDFTYGIIGAEADFNTLANDDKNKTTGLSGWIGYYPVEETLALRLGVEHLMFSFKDGKRKESETTIMLQMIFSLGPHKAHPF